MSKWLNSALFAAHCCSELKGYGHTSKPDHFFRSRYLLNQSRNSSLFVVPLSPWTILTKTQQMALSWARRIQSTSLCSTLSSSISVHVSHPGLCPWTGRLHSGFPSKLLLFISKYLQSVLHAPPVCSIKLVTCDLGNIESFLLKILIKPMFHREKFIG